MFRKLVAITAVAVVRFSLSAWVGGAILFVMTSVAEQINPGFDSVIRDQLATVRFPLYYLFGAITLSAAVVCGVAAVWATVGRLQKQMLVALILTFLSATFAAADYVWIYQPLQQMITPPGQVRTQHFMLLHNRSRHANEFHLCLALLAATAANLPTRQEFSAAATRP